MSVYKTFDQFLSNIKVRNAETISYRYTQITRALNRKYRGTESATSNCLQVGSYGRWSAIHGISDLDMVYEMPWAEFDRIDKLEGNCQSRFLQEVKAAILLRYPTTDVSADGQVVSCTFSDKLTVEVVPAFYDSKDDSHKYGDTNNGGSWELCYPRKELAAAQTMNGDTGGTYRKVCRMMRAWKDKQGAPMSGILLDTVLYDFFKDNQGYQNTSYSDYPKLLLDAFTYLANAPEKDFWIVPGSGSEVSTTGKFQRKAKKAAKHCHDANLEDGNLKKQIRIWRDLFGSSFPRHADVVATTSKSVAVEKEAHLTEASRGYRDTEKYIEDMFPLHIRYEMQLECHTEKNGSQSRGYLKSLANHFNWLVPGYDLKFEMVSTTVPLPYDLYWKVRNIGPVAEGRDCIRGDIRQSYGRNWITEKTSFQGEHYVECYAVKDGKVVAREQITVPIAV